MPKALCKQSKELIASLITYFERERDNGGPLIPLNAVRERAANALNLNIATVSAVSTTIKSAELINSPKRKKPRTKPIREIDEFDQVAIRNVIYEMYRDKQHITRKSLLHLLKERDLFSGSISSLGKILKDIGFRWEKDNPRRGLMELQHIALCRTQFLQKYVRNLKSNIPSQFVYLDETWIFENGSVSRSWQDNSHKSVKRSKSEGSRYIILHAGSRNGFVPGASLIFSSSKKNPDYHGSMNQDNFLKWFENQLLTNLEEPSIIVMDNASYHSTAKDKVPNTSWNKPAIQEWLQNKNIYFENNLFKVQLLELVRLNAPPKTYAADILAEQYGHTVLRLPPYHCIFNPIEQIWGIAKGYYNKHVGRDGYGVEKAISMWKEALDTATPDVWRKTIEHTEKEIKKWWDREVGFDRDEINPLIISINQDSEDDSCDCWDSDIE